MVLKISDILSRFTIKKTPNKQIEDAVREYFKEKQIILTGSFNVKLQNKKLSIFGDPYLVSYIKLNKGDLIKYLQEKISKLPIEEIV